MEALLFCDTCGAANTGEAVQYFVCHEPFATHTSSTPPFTNLSVSLGNGALALQFAETTQTSLDKILPAGFLLSNRYHILEQIGQGGFGIVYKARDQRRRHKLVVVKQINIAQLSPRDIIQATDSYNREIKLQPPLKHKQIPRVYDHFTDPEHWYLVMDFIPGETLEDFRKRAPGCKISQRETLRIGVQICQALEYLHTRNPSIIFRDLKPANIMRTRRGRLYLIDFGIARQYDSGKRKDTTPLDSPGYAAPEQYGTSQSTPQTDIYGLGATMLTLLKGTDPSEEPPNDGEADRPAASLSMQLQTFLDLMLERDATKRPKDIGVVRRRLRFIRYGWQGIAVRALLSFLSGCVLVAFPYLLYTGMWFGVLIHIFGFRLAFFFYSVFTFIINLTWPLLTVGIPVVALVLLCSARKRFLGLGLLAGLLLILTLLIGWHYPFP